MNSLSHNQVTAKYGGWSRRISHVIEIHIAIYPIALVGANVLGYEPMPRAHPPDSPHHLKLFKQVKQCRPQLFQTSRSLLNSAIPTTAHFPRRRTTPPRS